MSLIHKAISWLLLELPSKGKAADEMIRSLERDGDTVVETFREAAATPDNHKVMTHIIGIERWSQQRLQVALGEPFAEDEYDKYRPARDTPHDELSRHFAETRQQTIDLVQTMTPTQLERKVPHNEFGEMTVRAWLRYIRTHASLESKRL